MKMLNNKEVTIKELIMWGIKYSPVNYFWYFLFSVLIGLVTPAIIKIQSCFIDYANTTKANELLVTVGVLIFSYYILYFIDLNSQNLIVFFRFTISSKVEKAVILDYLNRFSGLEYKEYEKTKNQDLFYRIKETIKPIIGLSIDFLPIFFRNAIELIGILYFAIIADTWWIFPISILVSFPSFYFNKKRVLHARRVYTKDNKDMRYADYLHNLLINKESAKERRLFHYFNYVGDIWNFYFEKYNKNRIRDYIYSSLATGMAMFFSMSNIIIFGVFLINPLLNGDITLGLYISVLQMVTIKFNQDINTLIRIFADLTKIRDFSIDLNGFNQLEQLNIMDNKEKIVFESIEFENVWFKYPDTHNYILKGVSFRIEKGEKVAIIGLNGAGKTTITKLILGFYMPNSGNIYVNAKLISEYERMQLYSIYAYMEQKPVNYKLSMRESICLYHMESLDSDYKINKILKECQISYLQEKCSNNFDILLTPELEEGISLSGGEWQKLAIARIINSEREFFILDEPTASLDPISEINFYNEFKTMADKHTCLYITHRLGATYLFNRCLVLDDGVIRENGNHDELMKIKNGLYKQLFEKQKKWYETGGKWNEMD